MELPELKSIQNQKGEVVFAGTDVAVTLFFNYLKAAKTTEAFLEDYPKVSLEQVLDVLELADEQLKTVL